MMIMYHNMTAFTFASTDVYKRYSVRNGKNGNDR